MDSKTIEVKPLSAGFLIDINGYDCAAMTEDDVRKMISDAILERVFKQIKRSVPAPSRVEVLLEDREIKIKF